MHPTQTFSLLVTIASISGAFTWGQYLKNRPSTASPKTESATDAAGSLLSELTPDGAGAPGRTLEKQVQYLQEQNEQLKKENEGLRNDLANAKLASEPPPSEAFLQERFETLRRSKLPPGVKYAAVPLEEIGPMVCQSALSRLSPEGAAGRASVTRMLGFVADPVNYQKAISATIEAQNTTFYDAASQTAYYQDDADLKTPAGRLCFMKAVQRTFLQHHLLKDAPIPWIGENDDAARALRCVVFGEESIFREQWSSQDDLINLPDAPPPAQHQPPQAPYFFTDEMERVAAVGNNFIMEVLQRSADGLEKLYARPPVSTSELIHPQLYFADPPWKPEKVSLPITEVLGAKPILENTLGELGLQWGMTRLGREEAAYAVAEGWAGDRYAVWRGDSYGDHLLLVTRWQTPEDAKQFFDFQRRYLPRVYSIPEKAEYHQGRLYTITDPHRALRIKITADEKGVVIINSSSAPFAQSLEGALNL